MIRTSVTRTRRDFIQTAAFALATAALPIAAQADETAPYRTRYKYPRLLLQGAGNKADFDALSVDDPIIFRADGQLAYNAQTGFIASSGPLSIVQTNPSALSAGQTDQTFTLDASPVLAQTVGTLSSSFANG